METAAIATRYWTGPELALRRRQAALSQSQLAAQLGCTRVLIANIEAQFRPTGRAAERYLSALAAAQSAA